MNFQSFVFCLFICMTSLLEAVLINHAHTIHLSSCEDIYDEYQIQTAKYPEHVSFVTGQQNNFLFMN